MGVDGSFPWLTALILWPLVGAGLCWALYKKERWCRYSALVNTAVSLAFSIGLFVTVEPGRAGWLWFEDVAWIEHLGIRFTLGMDGLSLLLVLLTAVLMPVAVLVSFGKEQRHVSLFFGLLLVMESGILGVFLAQDLILFYLFWEVMLIPMLFLIGIWGHQRRVYAAVKFFLFTLAGSLLMLLAILWVYFLHGEQTGHYTFALEALRQTEISPTLSPWLFGAFFLAFAVKVPLVPVHTWLPDAHTEAPTAGSVILAGLLLKTGVYGLIRVGFPLFPETAVAFLPVISNLAMVGILYGSVVAFAQSDIKRLVAYSSIAHLGLAMLGFSAGGVLGWEGASLQLFNHGISTGALFAMVGMIDQRAKTRQIEGLGGLWARTPKLAALFLFFCLASMGLPGLNNFSGEILILTGVMRNHTWFGALGVAGMVLAAAYLLRLVQGVIWGAPKDDTIWPDLTFREGLVLVPLVVLVLWLGIHPESFLAPVREALRVWAGLYLPGVAL